MLVLTMVVAGLQGCAQLSQNWLHRVRKPGLQPESDASAAASAKSSAPGAPGLLQQRHTSGAWHSPAPAWLAALLARSGCDPAEAPLTRGVGRFPRARQAAAELADAARKLGLLAYIDGGGPAQLVAQLDAEVPVLVQLKFAGGFWPSTRFALVTELNTSAQAFQLEDACGHKHWLDVNEFLPAWDAAGQWSLSVHRTASVPGFAARQPLLNAAIEFEQQGQLEQAWAVYRIASERWPEDATPWTGFGNVRYLEGRYAQAVVYYRRALQLTCNSSPIMINLAWSLALCGQRNRALVTLDIARASATRQWLTRIHLCQQTIAQMPRL